ncbi:hypothetical protein [Veronia pacifica]|uniref:Uncharacterized protein n=1 Tax=Veronia pacifica TaxID=1080227 RepID=A0A1C3E9F2_9GAMM|nr:hypothetical protein [Veronia pacifica]ODA29875.1 hypothetical protein A8L45_21485 [Veronia pacifica]
MRIEQLLGKFGCKGINYSPDKQGKALFSVEEQLAMVGIRWSDAPTGWLLLFHELLNDKHAYRQLSELTLQEASKEMTVWRGNYPPQAILALVSTAILIASNLNGRICPECRGSGKTINRHRVTRSCIACKEGRVPWTNETKFAAFSQTLPVPYSRFNRYKPILEKLVDWLTTGRVAALLAIQGQIEKEKQEAQKVA